MCLLPSKAISVQMKRLFVAVKVEPENELLEQYQRFRKWFKSDRITWVEEKNLHMTLKFIGDTPEEKIPLIHDTLQSVASHHSAFDAAIKGAGIFGSEYKPRVLWFGVGDSWNKVSGLATDIIGALEEAGWENDRQNFVPHLTIGRIKYIRQRKKLSEKVAKVQQQHFQDIHIDAFHLIESRLSQDGPTYHILKTYALKQDGQAEVQVSGLPRWKQWLGKIGIRLS